MVFCTAWPVAQSGLPSIMGPQGSTTAVTNTMEA